jgi:Adenylyl/Guanylyl and SMODS C-terminal sensor domain
MGKASQLFNGNVEQTLIGRVTPTTEQREFLQKQWNDLADHLKQKLYENHDYAISTWLQGSYKFGTLIKPVHKGKEYDVDVGIYYQWNADEDIEPTPKQLRDWTQRELLEHKKVCAEVQHIESPPKERCCRAIYAHQFHIDTPVYHLDPDTGTRRLACFSDKWEDSDPKAIYVWFKEAVDTGDRDQLRRLVRYLKAWAAVSFDDALDSRPSSILLTVLTTEAYLSLWIQRLVGIDDDDALIKIIIHIHERLFDNKCVLNPVDKDEDLNRQSDKAWDAFLPRLSALKDIAERANEASDAATAALIWSEAFSFLMPLPETDQLEVFDQNSGHAVMQIPDIDIQVYAQNPRRLVTTHRNAVPNVAKDCELLFSIANPNLLPAYATVEWTVRNEGAEADARSDLGHRNIGMRLLSATESSRYIGRHFMDCVIRQNGQIYAVRRVPVTIRNLQYPARNPPRPPYTKIRMKLLRR